MNPTSQYATGTKPPQTPDKNLQRLRQACRLAFERYFDMASACSGEVTRLNPASPDRLTRVNLAILQRKEQLAYEAYAKAKANLVAALVCNDAAASAGN